MNEINAWWPLGLCLIEILRLTRFTFDICSWLSNQIVWNFVPKNVCFTKNSPKIFSLLIKKRVRNQMTLILPTFILLFHSDIWILKFYLNSFPFQWYSLLIVSNKWHQFRPSKWYFSCLFPSQIFSRPEHKSPLDGTYM